MAIRSMTGFARTEGTAGGVTWHWEVRSVNGRGLDVRLRLPPGFEALEPAVREAAAKRTHRTVEATPVILEAVERAEMDPELVSLDELPK